MDDKERVTRKIRRLLRTCEYRFTEWGLDRPFDITGLVEQLSRRRNRLIHLVPAPMGAAQPSGIWLRLHAMDVIVYEADTSRTHQEHIIAHELAHILCGHTTAAPVADEDSRLIFPDLDPQLVRDMLLRAEYDDGHELEAEVMASAILQRMNARPPEPAATGDSPETRGVLGRLERSFSIGGGGVG